MKLIRTEIPDVVIVEPTVFGDDRGWFMESFNEARWQQLLKAEGLAVPGPFIQDNHSCSRKGVLRGMHWQLPPHAQGKLVRVVQGAVFDVAVDIRRGSPTFGRWVGAELSAANRRQLWIPEGFAHGFLVLEDNTHFLYKTTGYYSRESERALAWNDTDVGIAWPFDRLGGVSEPQVAEKDACAPALRGADVFSKA